MDLELSKSSVATQNVYKLVTFCFFFVVFSSLFLFFTVNFIVILLHFTTVDFYCFSLVQPAVENKNKSGFRLLQLQELAKAYGPSIQHCSHEFSYTFRCLIATRRDNGLGQRFGKSCLEKLFLKGVGQQPLGIIYIYIYV